MSQSLVGLRNKIIEKMGPGVASCDALDVIAEFFNLPVHFETCTTCKGRGRVPYRDGSVPCGNCFMAGQMKVTTWELP